MVQGELTYGRIGEWRFDKRSYLRGPPPKNLPLPPTGVPESVVRLSYISILALFFHLEFGKDTFKRNTGCQVAICSQILLVILLLVRFNFFLSPICSLVMAFISIFFGRILDSFLVYFNWSWN